VLEGEQKPPHIKPEAVRHMCFTTVSSCTIIDGHKFVVIPCGNPPDVEIIEPENPSQKTGTFFGFRPAPLGPAGRCQSNG
jgi:hypothetical protein